MNNLRDHVAGTIRARQLVRAGTRVLVAVSGGVDSMVLLHLLHQLKSDLNCHLFVAHFNHQLRGRSSDADERYVVRKATELHLPAKTGRGNVKSWAARHGISLEMAARELRHQFLAQTAQRWRCSVIATAHHADDQVELCFLRLLRGAGGEGLAGMKWRSPAPANRRVQLVRPLLDVAKADLEAFARGHKIKFREDASNAARDILRNRVRHELLPFLREQFQPALERTVLRLMELVGAEAEVVKAAAQAWLAKPPRAAAWSKLLLGVQRRVLQLQLQRLKISPEFELIESLRLQPERAVSVNSQRSVVSDRSGRVTLAAAGGRGFNQTQQKLNLNRCSAVTFGGLQLKWNFAAGQHRHGPKASTCEFFDADQVGPGIILRHWRPGDRFQPIGMELPVKLQDWFTNQKIPAARRRELVVATTHRGDIFWIEGLRIGEQFKLTGNTTKTLVWRW